MKSKIIIILTCLFITFVVISAGFSSWTDELTVTGSVYVKQN